MPREPARVVVTTSWDDGHVYDFAVANLLDSYGLPGTFYVAPRNQELPPRSRLTDRDIAEIASRFEIGGHTLTHERIAPLSDDQARREMVSGKHYLEDCIGHEVTTFCYPGGEYRVEQCDLVAAAGFTLARTVERHRTDVGSDPMQVPTSFHAYQHLLDFPAARRMAPSWRTATSWFFNWDEWAIAMFDTVLATGGVFHLWGHSWELEDRKDWDRLERVLAHISRRDDVAYLPNSGLVSARTASAVSHVR